MNPTLMCSGGRKYDRADVVAAVMAHMASWVLATYGRPVVVIHGACGVDRQLEDWGAMKGADRLVHDWCVSAGVGVIPVPADWTTHGKAAGPKRNAEMVAMRPMWAIGFPGDVGTADCIQRAVFAGVVVGAVNRHGTLIWW